MTDIRKKGKRIVALTSKSGKPLHISSIGKEIFSGIKPPKDTATADTAGNSPNPQPVTDSPKPSKLMTNIADTPAPDLNRQPRRPSITRMWTGNNWAEYASASIDQKQLCGPLWYEGEICILFADTNVGKSILAVQIADMVANGLYCDTSLPELKPQTNPQSVVYADFELSIAQFGRRYSYSDPDNPTRKIYYDFSPRFNRVELFYDITSDSDAETFATKEFADQIIADLELRLKESHAKVLIIDNITFMASGTETAADAMPLMKKLVALKKRHDLSILLLAHTPKRSLSNPLTRNDLQGSKMLINFADSAFAIGESDKSKDIRYIKQIKQRNCEQVYDRDNVLVCRLGKVYENFIGFSSIGKGREDDHLADSNPGANRQGRPTRSELIQQATSLRSQGHTPDEIAARMNISRATAYRLIKENQQPQPTTN